MFTLRHDTSIEPSSQRLTYTLKDTRCIICILPRMKQLFDFSNHSHSELGYKPMISDAPKRNNPKDLSMVI